MVDFHTHSNISDGDLSPAALMELAKASGVSVIALTDHDSAEGIAQAQAAAAGLGLCFVPGIELNIKWNSGEFHLLGLGLQTISPQLESIIGRIQDERRRRNKEIMRKLAGAGFPVSMEELEQSARTGLIGRPHIAEYLTAKHITRNHQEAFDKYIAKDRPFYTEIEGAKLEDAVGAIKNSGGVPVTAHPLSLYVAWGKMPELFAYFREKGIAGIEAWHPAARPGDCERLEAMARKAGLIVTGGSDFHGETRTDRTLGHTSGGVPIDDRFWHDELRPLLEKLQAVG